MTEKTDSKPDLYALLIGIDCYLPNRLSDGMSYRSLGGSVRDINHVQEFLLRQPQRPTKIFKLTASNPDPESLGFGEIPRPKEAESDLPTYKNIVTRFQELTEIATPGDLIYIQYSGHGGRTKTNYPQIKGENGIDEALVPTDIGAREGQYLRDLELATLLKKMVEKGLVVTLVLDCCHSGGAVRGEDADIRGLDTIDMTPRPTQSLVASPQELAKNWLSLTSNESENSGMIRRKATAVASMLPEAKGYVLLAACRPSEYAYEYTFDRKRRNGALTYWLLDTLNQPLLGMTYKMLHDRINAKIKTLFPQQTPMLLGEVDRLVFGSKYFPREHAVTVMQVKVEENITKVQFDAGQAQGLRKGAEFAIYPRNLTSFRKIEQRLALVRITKLQASDSWGEVTTILNSESVIEQGAQAVLTSAPIKLVRKVRLLKDKKFSPERDAALQTAEMALNNNGWVELIETEEAADYQVDIKTITSQIEANKYQLAINELIYEICDRTGAPILLRPPVKVSESNAADVLVRRLVHLAKYQGIQELDNHDISSPLRGKVAMELLGKQKDYDPVDPLKPEPFDDPSKPEIQVGEYIFLKIRNDYSNILNLAVLDLQSDWAIEQMYPQTSQFISLEPGQEEFIPLRMSLREGERAGSDIFKVFATIGMANFRWLELPSLDRPILSPQARGVTRSGSPLDEFLMAFAAEQPTTRTANPVAFPSREWTTVQVRVGVKGDITQTSYPAYNQHKQPEVKSNQIKSNELNNYSYSSALNTSSTSNISSIMPNKILILAANPKEDLKLSREIRDIREGIRRSDERQQFELEQREALRPKDLQRALLETKPRIVHFCGHGSGNQGLVLENDLGQQQLVSTEAIADLFKLFTNQIECVVLNACYSKVQAQEIVKHINYVIGMAQDVRDDAAIAFTVGFYEALSFGKTIESAYKFGCNRIQLEINRSANYRTPGLVPVSEHLIPVLLNNPNPVAISNPVKEESEIPSTENSNESKQILDNRHGGIYFRDGTTVIGDVIGANKVVATTNASGEAFPKNEILQLLIKLKASIKEISLDEEEKDIAAGRVAAAIIEIKKIDRRDPQKIQEKIAEHLVETKGIIEQMKNIGEVSNKIFLIVDEIATLIDIPIL